MATATPEPEINISQDGTSISSGGNFDFGTISATVSLAPLLNSFKKFFIFNISFFYL
jgi:hypothetical protein